MKVRQIFKTLITNRLFLHVLFWVATFIILLNHFKVSAKLEKIDYIYTAIFQLTLMIAVYINLLTLIPKFLITKRIPIYILLLVLVLFCCSFFNVLLFSKLIDFILPGYYFISYYSLLDILKYFFVLIFLTTLLKLSKEWFQLVESKQKLIESEKEKVKLELKSLRSQVNPHFLFNSLNVVYSLALKQAKETPETIIKLSDILRYVIYDASKEKVNIKSEIELIKDYINLQNFRIDNSSKITFKTEIQNEIHIPPMLLLPLVENSFKHGVKGDLLNTYVNINLFVSEEELLFEIENNKGVSDNPTNLFNGGIGLKNIKQRLKLLYPNKHRFTISEDEKIFKVLLKIEL